MGQYAKYMIIDQNCGDGNFLDKGSNIVLNESNIIG
jgi:hypothetical protein